MPAASLIRELSVGWETKIFRSAGLGHYKNCLSLLEAYAASAAVWERALLVAYVGLGPPVARLFGGNTKTLWQQAESIIADIFNVSRRTPEDVVAELRKYMKLKRAIDGSLPFDQACERVYHQSFYPLVTHFTFAFQSSAVARLRFVRRVAAAVAFRQATVADLGCGSGAMLCEVLKFRPGWMGYGLDISPQAVAYARRLALHKQVQHRVHFQEGSVMDLPFSDCSLDLVIASEVLEHLPEPDKAFSEISRVLRPGGLLVSTIPIESNSPTHTTSLKDENEFRDLCRTVGLRIQSLSSKWHLTFGDDPRHLFVVAQSQAETETATSHVYSLLPPQISSAARSGIISS